MMKIFGREPAAWLGLIQAVLLLIVSFGLGFTDVQANLVMAAIVAVGGAVTAVMTKPFVPGAVLAAVTAVSALLAGFRFDVPPEVTGAVGFFAVQVISIVLRANVSPRKDDYALAS